MDQDAARPEVLTERFGKTEQSTSGAALERQKAGRREHLVDIAKAAGEQRRDVPVDFGLVVRKCVESCSADETQLRFADRTNRGRTRLSIDHRQVPNQRSGTKDCEDALAARRREDVHLQQTFVDPVAAVAGIASEKQRLLGGEMDDARLTEQASRQRRGKIESKVSVVAEVAFAMAVSSPCGSIWKPITVPRKVQITGFQAAGTSR